MSFGRSCDRRLKAFPQSPRRAAVQSHIGGRAWVVIITPDDNRLNDPGQRDFAEVGHAADSDHEGVAEGAHRHSLLGAFHFDHHRAGRSEAEKSGALRSADGDPGWRMRRLLAVGRDVDSKRLDELVLVVRDGKYQQPFLAAEVGHPAQLGLIFGAQRHTARRGVGFSPRPSEVGIAGGVVDRRRAGVERGDIGPRLDFAEVVTRIALAAPARDE